MGLAEQRLAHHRNLEAAFPRLDDRAQTCAAGTDHDDVVGVPFDLSHETSLNFLISVAFDIRGIAAQPTNLRSGMAPAATSAM
jgi:hypothetical protein